MTDKQKNGKWAMTNMPLALKLITVMFFLPILPASGQALTPDQVFDKVKDSIVVVKTLDAQGKMKGQGSGVLIFPGKVATNCHVVEGGATYLVGRGKELSSAILYAEDGDKDICILDAKGITGKPVQLGKAANLKIGVPVYAVGAPQGLELSLSDGIVSQLRGGLPPLIQTTAAISPGSSGGGLFDVEGRLVGLTTLRIEGEQSLNFAIPVEWIGEVKPSRKPAPAPKATEAPAPVRAPLQAEPAPSTGTGGVRRYDWTGRYIDLFKKKDWQGLRDMSQEWTRSEPQKAVAWSTLGFACSQLKLYNDAIDAYRQALRIDPDNAGYWYSLGSAYKNLKRYDAAIEAYRKSTSIDPKDSLVWFFLGNTYDALERYNDSIDAYRRALRIDQKHAFSWYYLGAAFDNLKRYDDAIEAYRQSLRIYPENNSAWNSLGFAYQNLSRYDDAIAAYRKAVSIDPKNADAWNNLAISYALSGNHATALDAVKELRLLDPERADKLFNQIVPR